MITIILLIGIIYFILKLFVKDNGTNNNESRSKKSWFERNLWMIAVTLAIFALRMCHTLG